MAEKKNPSSSASNCVLPSWPISHSQQRSGMPLRPPNPIPHQQQEDQEAAFPTISERLAAEALLLLSQSQIHQSSPDPTLLHSAVLLQNNDHLLHVDPPAASSTPLHATVQKQSPAASPVAPVYPPVQEESPAATPAVPTSVAPVYPPVQKEPPAATSAVPTSVAPIYPSIQKESLGATPVAPTSVEVHSTAVVVVQKQSPMPSLVSPVYPSVQKESSVATPAVPTSVAVHSTAVVVVQHNRIHRCDQCCATFTSGQALGGHKTKHRPKLPPIVLRNPTAASTSSINPAISGQIEHWCSKCSEVFSSGQVLDGHKRKHYEGDLNKNGRVPKHAKESSSSNSVGSSACPVDFDLNLPPPPESDDGAS